MTFLAFVERHKVKAASGPPYLEDGGRCSNPSCTRMGVEKHHITRRSELAGAYDWVEYDGLKIGNVVLLCHICHLNITDNKARIGWNEEMKRYTWGDIGKMVLDPHPPVEGSAIEPHPPVEEGREVVEDPANDEICRECKRPFPRKHKHEEGRVRKTWSLAIPADERENGADVLDTLVEESRKMLADNGVAYSDDKKAKYYIVSAVLGMFVLHGSKILGDS